MLFAEFGTKLVRRHTAVNVAMWH